MSMSLLEQSFKNCPIIDKNGYKYFVHPLCDGVPAITPDLLNEAVDKIVEVGNFNNVDKIVTIEALGIPLTTAVSLKTNIPFVVIRKRPYGLHEEIQVKQKTDYSESVLYIKDVQKDERVVIIDDVVSTGGTLSAVINALKQAGVEIVDVIVLVDKGGSKIVEQKTGIKVKSLIKWHDVNESLNLRYDGGEND